MIFEGKGVDECADSPFALALFDQFSEIGEVFISNNFVTLTKVDDSKDWFEVIYTIKAFMHTYITEGNVIVSDRFIEAYKESMKSQSTGAADIEQKIIHLRTKKINYANNELNYRKWDIHHSIYHYHDHI